MPLFQAFAHIDRAAVTARTARPDSCPVTLIRLPMPSSATLAAGCGAGLGNDVDRRSTSGRRLTRARWANGLWRLDSDDARALQFGRARHYLWAGWLYRRRRRRRREYRWRGAGRRLGRRRGGHRFLYRLSRNLCRGRRRDLRLWLWGRRRRLRRSFLCRGHFRLGWLFGLWRLWNRFRKLRRWAFARLRNSDRRLAGLSGWLSSLLARTADLAYVNAVAHLDRGHILAGGEPLAN